MAGLPSGQDPGRPPFASLRPQGRRYLQHQRRCGRRMDWITGGLRLLPAAGKKQLYARQGICLRAGYYFSQSVHERADPAVPAGRDAVSEKSRVSGRRYGGL